MITVPIIDGKTSISIQFKSLNTRKDIFSNDFTNTSIPDKLVSTKKNLNIRNNYLDLLRKRILSQ
jgi:hypothetical protein